jgi:hypothetical protein
MNFLSRALMMTGSANTIDEDFIASELQRKMGVKIQ